MAGGKTEHAEKGNTKRKERALDPKKTPEDGGSTNRDKDRRPTGGSQGH